MARKNNLHTKNLRIVQETEVATAAVAIAIIINVGAADQASEDAQGMLAQIHAVTARAHSVVKETARSVAMAMALKEPAIVVAATRAKAVATDVTITRVAVISKQCRKQ